MTRTERNRVSIELPNNWEVWDQKQIRDPDVLLAAKAENSKWPNIEITKIGRVSDTDVENTKRFAHSWLEKQGLSLINERILKVTGRDAYEFSYFKEPLLRVFGDRIYFCKVSVVRRGIEYLIQLASKDLNTDKPVFERIVSSMRFEYATDGLTEKDSSGADFPGRSESSNREKAVELLGKAFLLVERGEYDTAIDLLKQALKIDPSYGEAHNELAFIYGRKRGDLDLAEKHARQAIECDPNNPKFYNSINGIQLDRAKRLKTRREIREKMVQRLQEIQYLIDSNPTYPPAYLTKAVTLALNGEPKHIWEAELKHGEELYLEQRISSSCLLLTPQMIEVIITRNRNLCLEMSSYWTSTPEN